MFKSNLPSESLRSIIEEHVKKVPDENLNASLFTWSLVLLNEISIASSAALVFIEQASNRKIEDPIEKKKLLDLSARIATAFAYKCNYLKAKFREVIIAGGLDIDEKVKAELEQTIEVGGLGMTPDNFKEFFGEDFLKEK